PDGTVTLSAHCTTGDEGQARLKVARDMPDAIIKVAPGASIAGRVVDGAGKPVVGIGVMASKASSTERPERIELTNGVITSGVRGLSDASGAYRLAGLSPGAYQLAVLDRGKPVRQRAQRPRVELAPNEHKTRADPALRPPRGGLPGTAAGA